MSNFFAATKIADNEKYYRNSLIDAFDTARNARSVSTNWRRIIRKNRIDCVSAAHPASRLKWATTVSDVIGDRFCPEDLHHRPELFFVTLIDRDWLTTVNVVLDLAAMKHKIRKMTAGRSSFFIVEAGYYSNIQDNLFSESAKRAISWHVHGLMWGVEAAELKALVDGLNSSAKYQTMIPSRKPADCKVIKQQELPAVVGYMTKPPTKAYRVFCLRKKQLERQKKLGVAVSPEYRQRGQTLRPGERVRLFHALKDIDPLDLLIGGGDGRRLVQQIRSRLR